VSICEFAPQLNNHCILLVSYQSYFGISYFSLSINKLLVFCRKSARFMWKMAFNPFRAVTPSIFYYHIKNELFTRFYQHHHFIWINIIHAVSHGKSYENLLGIIGDTTPCVKTFFLGVNVIRTNVLNQTATVQKYCKFSEAVITTHYHTTSQNTCKAVRCRVYIQLINTNVGLSCYSSPLAKRETTELF